MKCIPGVLIAVSLLLGSELNLPAQSAALPALRPPATPLIVHDPYFSIWSTGDRLTDGPTKHWTGTPQPINGLVRIDGKTYRYLGDADRKLPALQETRREITPTRTIIALGSPEIDLNLTFLTPSLPEDLKVMARPVTYVEWAVKSRDGRSHDVVSLPGCVGRACHQRRQRSGDLVPRRD